MIMPWGKTLIQSDCSNMDCKAGRIMVLWKQKKLTESNVMLYLYSTQFNTVTKEFCQCKPNQSQFKETKTLLDLLPF
jgi:hypothetical protein